MSLSMSMGMHQVQVCVLCGESVEDHSPTCPQGQLDLMYEQQRQQPKIVCPGCGGQVGVNSEDFYECRGCKTQFTTGSHFDTSKRERATLKVVDGADILTVILAVKGKGCFKIDQLVAKWETIVKEAREDREAT